MNYDFVWMVEGLEVRVALLGVKRKGMGYYFSLKLLNKRFDKYILVRLRWIQKLAMSLMQL